MITGQIRINSVLAYFGILSLILIGFVFTPPMTESKEVHKNTTANSADFELVPLGYGGIMLRISPTTKPGVIAFKINALGKVKAMLVKRHNTTLSVVSEEVELEVQRMDIAKFLCDACGATHIYIKSVEEGDHIFGTVEQIQ